MQGMCNIKFALLGTL